MVAELALQQPKLPILQRVPYDDDLSETANLIRIRTYAPAEK